MILKGAFGVHLFANRSDESLIGLKNIDGKNIHSHFSTTVKCHITVWVSSSYMVFFH